MGWRAAKFGTAAELRHTDVVKNDVGTRVDPGTGPESAVVEVAPEIVDAEIGAGTRDRVARSILENGASTAASLAERLALTPAAVRRHLDALLAEGLIVPAAPRIRGQRGRGRPARAFALTEAGRDAFFQAYDDLAASALRFLAEVGGDDAVASFAQRRVAELEDRYRPVVAAAAPGDRAAALAGALSADGYAATARPAPGHRRRAGLPAPLPGGPRRRAVPPAVRGRDQGLRAITRNPRPAPGDDRPGRRRLHDLRPVSKHNCK